MKVLVINWRDIKNPEAGGAEIHIDEILKRKPPEWEVDFVSASFKGAPAEEDINGYHIIRIPNNFLFNFTFIYYWFMTFSKNNYDLIIDDISKIPLATPLYIKNTPIVAVDHHIHGKSLFKELPLLMAFYVYILERFFLNFYTIIPIIAVSESTKKELISINNYKKIFVSHNGIEFEFLKQNNPHLIKRRSNILYFGRLKRYKRIDHIIQALLLIKKRIPEAELIIAGKGDDEERLKELVNELKLNESVHFLGFISDNQKSEIIHESTVFMIASEKEGWGISVLEANAGGLPVIGYDVEGLRDSIKEGYSGFLAENGNIEELAGKAILLLENKELMDRMSNESIVWASNFSWDNMALNFYRVINLTLVKD